MTRRRQPAPRVARPPQLLVYHVPGWGVCCAGCAILADTSTPELRPCDVIPVCQRCRAVIWP